MSKVTNRYTDKELIERIWVWCSDYNRIPTQRDILNDDRMPTHHTYINRFGSIKESMKCAKVDEMIEIPSAHDTIKSLIDDERCNFKVIDEYVKVNGIVIDFKMVDRHGEIHYVDLVFLRNVHNEVLEFVDMYRKLQMGNENYMMISSIDDLTLALYSRS